jgi:hypothetical protein
MKIIEIDLCCYKQNSYINIIIPQAKVYIPFAWMIGFKADRTEGLLRSDSGVLYASMEMMMGYCQLRSILA